MENTVWINADHGRDFITDHITKLRYFTKGDNFEFSAFPFSFQLMFDETLSIFISHNEFQMRLTKKSN